MSFFRMTNFFNRHHTHQGGTLTSKGKHPSAANHDGSGSPDACGRHAFATRGSLLSIEGSGAPLAGRFAAALVAAALLMLLAAGAARAAYTSGTPLSMGAGTSSVAVNQGSQDVYGASAGSFVSPSGFKRFDKNGSEIACSLTTPTPEHPGAVTVNPTNGNLGVLDFGIIGSSTSLRVFGSACGPQIGSSITVETPYTSPIPQPVSDSSGNIFVPVTALGKVQRFKWNAGATQFEAEEPANPITGLTNPNSAALDSAGNVYVVDAPVSGINEKQKVEVKADAGLGGTYTLSYEGQTTGWTGQAPLVGETGTADLSASTGGTGKVSTGSKIIKSVTAPTTGAYALGQIITIAPTNNPALPANTTIAKLPGEGGLSSTELEVSAAATGTGSEVTKTLATGSKTITNVTGGPYTVGHAIEGTGVAGSTTIASCAPSCAAATSLELSAKVTLPGTGVALTAGAKAVTGLVTSTGKLSVGEELSGTGIQAGTTVTAVNEGAGTLTLSKAPSVTGTSSLSADLPFGISTTNLQGALEKLTTIGTGNVEVTGSGPPSPVIREVQFKGALGGMDVADLGCSAAGLTGTNPSCAVSTVTPGRPARLLKFASDGTAQGAVLSGKISTVAINKGIGVNEIFVGSGQGASFHIEKYSSSGAKLADFGTGVFASGDSNAYNQLAIDETSGRVYAADPGHSQIQVFNISPGGAVNLTLEKSGIGSGTVASAPSGINCGAACPSETKSFEEESYVTLTATAASGSGFVQWENCDEPGPGVNLVAGQCRVKMTAAKTVKAEFAALGKKLKVIKSGAGTGTVASDVTGVNAKAINCGSDCEETFTEGTVVKLTPAADSGSAFKSWSGCDAVVETNKCEVTMSVEKTATATFGAKPAVTTEAATATTKTTATLNGKVNPNEFNVTDCHFEYSTSALPAVGASEAACVPAPGSGASPVSVSASVSGLTAGTLYHFRLIATNSVGTTNGTELTVTTNPLTPPIVTTTAGATNVRPKAADVAGTVNPNGLAVETCEVEYGTTSGYGSKADCASLPVGTGTSPLPVGKGLTGLSSNTTYHFRFVATNADGKGTGGDQTFITEPLLAPVVLTEAATATAKTTTTLNGTVNPKFEEVSDCHFDYGTTIAYGQTAPCSPAKPGGSGNSAAPASAAISGLTANTTYHFRLVATNAGGTTNGADETLKTTLDNKPIVTTAAGATNIAQTTAKVAGTVNPNGLLVTSCKVEYGTSLPSVTKADCVPAPGSGTSAVAVSAELSGLTANTTYKFRFLAVNSDGEGQGGEQEFTTLPNAPTVTIAAASEITQTTMKLNGTVNPNSGNVSACSFEYGTTVSYGQTAPCVPASPGSGSSPVSVSASVSGLSPNTTYHFRLKATNAGGSNVTADETATTLVNAPTVTAPSASEITQTAMKLSATVNPNSGNVSACSFEYGTTVSYGQTAPCVPASPGSGSSPVSVSASVSGLSPNTTYHFRLKATNAGGTNSSSDASAATLPNAPTVTTTAGATSIAQTTATVAGTVNPNGGNVSACKVKYGTTTAYGSEADCASLPGSGSSPVAVSKALSGLTANTTYHFKFTATNVGGSGEGTDQEFKTLPSAPTVANDPEGTLTQTTVVLNGKVNANGVDTSACNFQVTTAADTGFSSPVKTVACSPATVLGSAGNTAVTATATGLTANTNYIYRVVATNSGGTTNGTPAEPFSTLPNAPTVTTTAGATSIAQTTATVAGTVNPNGGNVSACKVEYGTTATYGSQASCASLPGSGSSAVAVSKGLTGLTANTTYHFRFAATNAGGSANGSDQTFTTLANTCATDASLCPPPTPTPTPTCADTPSLCPPPVEGTPKVKATAPASGGKASLTIACQGGGACKGTLELSAKIGGKKKTIGKASYNVAAGGSQTIKVKLSAAAKKLLNEGKAIKATLSGGVKGTVKLKPVAKKKGGGK